MTSSTASTANRPQSIRWVASNRPEWIGDISFVANTAQQLPTNGGILPSDRFYYALRLQLEGRVTMPGATGPAAQTFDGIAQLIENIQIQGFSRPRGAQELFFYMRGSDTYQYFGITSGRYGGQWYYAVTGTIQQNDFDYTASHATDFKIFYDIIFPPSFAHNSPSILNQQAKYLLDAPNYDRLTMTLQWGDLNSVFKTNGTNATLSAFGSGSGSARCRVYGIYAMGGKSLFSGYVPARVWRLFTENASGDITTVVTQSRQFNFRVGYQISRLFLKTGVKSTNVTGGNNSYATSANNILANLKVNRGTNRLIAYYVDQYGLGEQNARDYGLSPNPYSPASRGVTAAGYFNEAPDIGTGIVDWISHGHLGEALQTQNLVAGPTGDVDLYLAADTNGAANTAVTFMEEELRGVAQFVTPAANTGTAATGSTSGASAST